MGADIDKRRIDVMVSSTFLDLVDCRDAVIDAAEHLDLNPTVMEQNPAPNADLIDASLAMVNKANIYVGLLGLRYGAAPECPKRNPDGLSLTELEYNRAKERNIPRLMFEIGEDFNVPRKIVNMAMQEGDAGRHKRDAFRASIMKDRILQAFDSAEQLGKLAAIVLGREKAELERQPPVPVVASVAAVPAPISTDLHPLNSPYIMQRDLVGRVDELNRIDAWARQPPGGMLLFQAIGGMGKSALTWHWAKDCALTARPDLRGRLWYSFYEQGTSLRDFLTRTLAHITGQTPEALKGKSSYEMGLELRHALDHEPWLLVLDGLERVLIAYNRPDKDYASDEEAALAKDGLGLDRKARDCIRPEDDRILASLAQTQRSKILASSRLLPIPLTSDGEHPIAGVTHIALDGLSPPDGVQLLIDAGVKTADPANMQNFLKKTFACHPLSIQVIPGLIRNLVHLGPLDFDTWLNHPKGGRDPGLLAENLRGRQNHILAVAFAALDDDEKSLLASLSIMTASLTREIIELLSPRRAAKTASSKVSEDAEAWLWSAVQKLSDHGLAQYDVTSGALDLHPAVRHTALTRLSGDARKRTGKRVADALTARAVVPFAEVDSVAELQFALDRVRALSAGGQLEAAAQLYRSGLSVTLVRLGGWPEILELLQDLLPSQWRGAPDLSNDPSLRGYVLNDAAIALEYIGQLAVSIELKEYALRLYLGAGDARNSPTSLLNLAAGYEKWDRRFAAARTRELAGRLAEASERAEGVAYVQLNSAAFLLDSGDLESARSYVTGAPPAESFWEHRNNYEARRSITKLRLAWRGGQLDQALAEKTYATISRLKEHRFELPTLDIIARWRQANNAHIMAVDAFDKAITLARRMGIAAVTKLEVNRARSCLALGQREEAARTAAAASVASRPPHISLAELYLDLGNHNAARRHVLEGYRQAWSDGPPHSHHWNLERCRKVLTALGEPEPELPPFDAANHPPLPFAAEVEALIAKTLAEREA